MNLRLFLTFAFGIKILLWAGLAHGQNVLTSDLLDSRNRIEAEVQKNLQQLVSTQLDPRTFTLAVRASITTIQPPKPDQLRSSEGLPAGMDLGTIDVRELVRSYEKQIEELKIRQEAKKDQPMPFQLRSMEVIVGLDKTYGEPYSKQFSEWLKNKIVADYGPIAKSTVNLIELKNVPASPEKTIEPPVGNDKDGSLLKNFVLILAALFLSIAILLLGRSLKNGLIQVATASKPISIEPKGKWSIESLNEKNEIPNENSIQGNEGVPLVGFSELDRLTSKIAFVCLELSDKINSLVRVWIDSGDDGFMKTALLVDTLVNAREKIMTQTGAIAPIRIPIDEEIVKTREENLSEAYRNVATMSANDKTQLLEQIYWDLISFRTLGLQSLRRPFDYLQGMPKESVIELLKTQKDDAKALAISYLPAEIQSDVINEYDDSKKSEVIKNMLLQSQISQKQIWDLDTSVKVATVNQSSASKEKLVNIFPRTVEVLSSLNSLDEINILRQIAPQLPESGLQVKQQYSTLAFIDEWKTDYVKKLVQVATSDEILALIKVIPTTQNLVLDLCSAKVKMIVEDDLKLDKNSDSSALSGKISSLKNKWNRISASENLPMSKVINSKASIGDKNAA